jgi:hypothetical protein
MAYIFCGHTGQLLHSLESDNPEIFGHFGISVCGTGDVSGDGIDDVLVGAFNESPGTAPTNEGRAYVFSGATGEHLCTLSQETNSVSPAFGLAVSCAGDVNNDGSPDIIVGAAGEDFGSGLWNAGEAYVYSLCPLSTRGALVTGPSLMSLNGPTPNPTNGAVNLGLRILNGGSRQASLTLYDAAGRRIETVLQRTIGGDENVNLTYEPRADIPSGVYYWRLETEGFTTQKPMVLVR